MAQPASKIVQANDHVAFEVLVAGEGEPLVYFHGSMGLDWNPFLDELSNHYKVYAPYLPGTGGSRGLEAVRDVWELMLAYDDLFAVLGLDEVNLMGFSLGGMLAHEYAALFPSKVRRLIAIAPAGLQLEAYPLPNIFAMDPKELLPLSVADTGSELARKIGSIPEDPKEKELFMLRRERNLRAAAKFIWPHSEKTLGKRLYRIQSPALLIWGKEDRIVSPRYAEEFQRGMKRADVQVVMIEQASHLVAVEKTGEVMRAILSFMNN